jgi:hypothetical protein
MVRYKRSAERGAGEVTHRDRILGALSQLGEDEAEVLALAAERLAIGRRAYAELHLDADKRDFRLEALEECADGLVYVAAALARLRRCAP